ncbi:hypothetical protein G6714_00105 [Polynucleobacter paneuropaeus]|nr:hypothetical protein [Polynucleobacter paneuropaeus]
MSNLNQLFANPIPSTPKAIRLIDGKVTVYKRPQSAQWQCRFKLANNKWHSASTGTDELTEARRNAIVLYETVRIKIDSGLALTEKTFGQLALEEMANMRRQVEIPKRIREWWFKNEAGKVCVSVKYGTKVIELAKGKHSVEVDSAQNLVKALETIKSAVEQGELDSQIELASGALKLGFKK